MARSVAPQCIEWKKLTLSNGIPLFVAERHAFPSAAIRIVLATGGMTSSAVANGGATRLDLLAATYLTPADVDGNATAGCTQTACWVAERMTPAAAADTLGRLGAWITRPQAEGPADIQRFAAAADALRRGEDSPRLTLWRNAEVMAWGLPFNAHGRSIAEPTMADVVQARAQLLRPAAATLVVTGDVSADDVRAQAERAFGGWRSDGETSPHVGSSSESTEPSFAPRVVYVPQNRAAPVTAVVVRGPGSRSADAWAFRIAVQILGGGMESEIYVHVREEMAAAYATGAEVRWLQNSSIAAIGGPLERGKVVAATRVMVSSVRALREKGPAPEVLDRAKMRLKAEVRDSASTNWLLASSLEVVDGDAQPLDLCEAETHINAVTASDVWAALRTYFAEKRLGVVVIAREDQLDAWPEDLNMGRVQRRDWLGQDAH
jgi:predicted Zn-dependent peptidase